MAVTGLRITIPPLQHHDRRHNELPLTGTRTCLFLQRRKQLHSSLLTARTPSVRSNASQGLETGTSRRRSFYELLEVSREVSFEEVKMAYRRLALRYHPDVSPPDLAQENASRFIEIREAYQTLSDPRRREVYDSGLHLGVISATTSARWRSNEELDGWKRRWQNQLEKLKRRSSTVDAYSNSNTKISWGSKMREKMADQQIYSSIL